MKRLLGLLLAAAMLLSLAPSVAAYTYACQDVQPRNYHTGFLTGNIFNGAWANIDPGDASNSFSPCTVGVGNDGVFAYVAIEPSGQGPDAILQIGMARSNNPAFFPTTPIQYRYFVAAGGCGYAPLPQVVGNQSSPIGSHKYRIERGTGASSSWWYAYVDSTLMYQWNGATDSHLSCWINGSSRNIEFSAEAWDRGDSIGSPSDATYFNGLTYKSATTNAWITFNIGSGVGCNENGEQQQGGAGTNTTCNIYSSHDMYVYRP